MKLVNGAMVLEQCEYPGNIGDSCAETSRFAIIGNSGQISLVQFITEMGFIRHPDAPEDWRERDFSGDQAEPLALANSVIRETIRDRTKANSWRTGNGELITPRLYAILTGKRWLLAICILAQGLLFKLPWRWSDSRNKFEITADSSADYLNYIVAAIQAPRWSRCLTSAALLKQKVRDYYKPEPNSQWVIDAYDAVISKEFRK